MISHEMKFARLTWTPKAAHFWPEVNILLTALGGGSQRNAD